MPSEIVKVLIFAIVFAAMAQPCGASSMLPQGEHCVAYRAKKTLFLVTAVDVIGRSCEAAVQVIPELDRFYRIEMSLPIASLKSGEIERDQDVANLLKSSEEPDLVYVSDSLSLNEWRDLAKKKQFTLNGFLKFGGNTFPLRSEILVIEGEQGLEVDGVARTTFRDLHLKPPVLWLGLFARVKNDLELHFHFLAKKTLGLDSLLAK